MEKTLNPYRISDTDVAMGIAEFFQIDCRNVGTTTFQPLLLADQLRSNRGTAKVYISD